MLNARFTPIIAASFAAILLSLSAPDATARSTRSAGPGVIQIAQNNPAKIIGNLKNKLSSAQKKASAQLESAKKFRSLSSKKHSAAQLRKQIADARKAEQAIKSQQSTVAKMKQQLGKFKSAKLPGPIKSKFKAASNSLKDAEKSLGQARAQMKVALATLLKAAKAQTETTKRLATAKADSRKSTRLLSQAKSAMALLKTKSTSKSRAAMNKLKSSQRSGVMAIGRLVAAGNSSAARGKMQRLVQGMSKGQANSTDIGALVFFIMRESYVEQMNDLKSYADKVKKFNAMKSRIRAKIIGARDASSIKSLEKQLATVGNDAQLANVDLQNSLQKQQQTLQMVSNVSKMLHDTAMAVIRKLK